MMPTIKTMIQHMEAYLGPIRESWRSTPDGEEVPFQIVRCEGGVEDTRVFCTLGLSNHAFKETPSAAGVPIRHELLIAVRESDSNKNVPTLVQQLGLIALSRHRAFLQGEVIGGTHPAFVNGPFRGFGASFPSFISEDEFSVFKRTDGQEVVFVWMIPLYREEIDFVRKEGWSRFEDLVIEKGLDLVEIARGCLIADSYKPQF
jgi:hypothetical protein